MTDGEPKKQIPDSWVPLARLPWWIRHIYYLEGGDVIRHVVLALRRGPHLRIVWPGGPTIVQPSEWDKLPRNVVNWRTGLITSPRAKCPIEAKWEAVIPAVADWQHAEASPKPAPSIARRGGGRRQKYNWARVTVELLQRLQDDGAPTEGDGGQAELEEFVARSFSPDDCPSESRMRDWVRETIKAYRDSLP